MLPALLFAIGWLKPPIAIFIGSLITLSACAFIGDLYHALGRLCTSTVIAPASFASRVASAASAGLVIMLWLSLSGAGGVGYQNTDYRASNALLKDLTTQPWPLRLTLDKTLTPVTYYVGYYLPAAAAGKVAGWYAANAVLFLWTALGVFLAFAWFLRLAGGPRDSSWITALIFCFAGGLDLVGYYFLTQKPFDLDGHVDTWAGYFQYSSNTTLLYWVPQHAIAAWLLTGLVLSAARHPARAPVVAVSLASAILWSPFGVLGLMPFAALAAAQWPTGEIRRWLLSPAALLMQTTALGLAVVHLSFLAANRFAFPISFVWHNESGLRVLGFFLAFEFLEFGLLASLLVLMVLSGVHTGRRGEIDAAGTLQTWSGRTARLFGVDRWHVLAFGAAVSVLGVLPIFKMGANNDLVMRGSIPALFAFWTFVAAVLTRTDGRLRRRLRGVFGAIVVVVVVGGSSGLAAISRSIQQYRFGPPKIDSVETTAQLPAPTLLQRCGRSESFFFRVLARR